jgi:integrase
MFKHNHFSSLASSTEIIRKNGTKYTVRQNRFRYFFPDEWMSFYDKLKPKQKVTFNFLINTGARINEVRNISIQDIDFDRNSIIIRWGKARNKDGTRRIRVLPVSTQFIKWCKALCIKYKLKPADTFPILSTGASNTCLKKTLRDMGILDWKMFSIHNIRKTLETWLISLDIDSMKVSKHFGHSIMVASKFYISPDTFNHEDKSSIRQIIGDLYSVQRGY